MFQVGDSASYFLKAGGQQTGVVTSVGESHVIVLDGFGDSARINVRDAKLVNDGRMARLRILDVEDPAEAKLEREGYMEKWLLQVSKNSPIEEESPRTPKHKKVVQDDGLAGRITKIILEAGEPLGKSGILKALGEVPPRWNEVIDSVMKSGKVQRTGKKRGTKYSRKEN